MSGRRLESREGSRKQSQVQRQCLLGSFFLFPLAEPVALVYDGIQVVMMEASSSTFHPTCMDYGLKWWHFGKAGEGRVVDLEHILERGGDGLTERCPATYRLHSAWHAALPTPSPSLPLPHAGRVAFSFSLNYPKYFLKAPGNVSKRIYRLRV